MSIDDYREARIREVFPNDFESRTAEHQRAWLKLKIPQFRDEISRLEVELATAEQEKRSRRETRERQSQKSSGWRTWLPGAGLKEVWKDPLGFGGMADLAKDLSTTAGAAELDLKREQLIELQARYEALSPPAQPQKSPEETPEQKREGILAKMASLDKELDKALRTISDPEVAASLRAITDDKKHRLLQELRKM